MICVHPRLLQPDRPAAIGLLLLSAAIALLSGSARADLPLVADDEIPEQLTRVDSDGIHLFARVSLDEHWFDGFSLGGSDDLPAAEAERLRALVSELEPHQWLFVQATADTTHWRAHPRKDNHRLDVDVAMARNLWGLDHLKRKRVTTLPPRLAASERGLRVYVASYDERVIPFAPTESPVTAPPALSPSYIIEEKVEPPLLALGLEVGYGVLDAGGFTLATPTVDLVIEKAEVRLDLGVGWQPAGDSSLGDLADVTTKVTVSWFPPWIPTAGHVGPFLGWVAGSEFVRNVTEYVVLAHGPAIGATARADVWVLTGAVRAGYARVSLDELDQKQRWTNGFVFNIQIGKVF